MILVDASVWIDHLRATNQHLNRLLAENLVLLHPFIAGELAMGNLFRRQGFLSELTELPQAAIAEHDEVLNFIQQHRLYGRGIGYIDAHLLVSTRLTAGAHLWSRDKRLHSIAQNLGLAL